MTVIMTHNYVDDSFISKVSIDFRMDHEDMPTAHCELEALWAAGRDLALLQHH